MLAEAVSGDVKVYAAEIAVAHKQKSVPEIVALFVSANAFPPPPTPTQSEEE